MTWIKNLAFKLLGKKVIEDGIAKVGLSKTKLAAVVYVLIIGTETVSAAWGHPIVIPDSVKSVLAGVGLWSLRDSVK